jgi:hypothetical protein
LFSHASKIGKLISSHKPTGRFYHFMPFLSVFAAFWQV